MKTSLKYFFLIFFSIIACLFEGYFGFFVLVRFFIQILLIAIVLYFFVGIFRPKKHRPFKQTIIQYMIVLVASTGFFVSILLTFIGYQHWSPATLSDITLTHSGGRQVMFLEMSHIATADFYNQKNQKLQTLAKQGYIILAEGVGSGSLESQRNFDVQMGFNFTTTLYASIAQFIGLKAQDSSLYESISSGSVVSVDLSLDDIVSLMGTGTSKGVNIPIDLESELIQLQKNMVPREKMLVSWMVRAILNWSLKNTTDMMTAVTKNEKKHIFDIIIDRRNDRIVEYIIKNPDKNIVIVYGALHFNGIYESLQKLDNTWKIQNIQTYTPYNQ